MRQRGEITPVRSHDHLYEVIVPYARQGFVDEREILFERHPYATLSHRSALEFHGLTDDLSKDMTVTVSADVSGGLLPIGTKPRDWEGVARPGATQPAKILGTSVEWLRTKPDRFFGFEEFEPIGFPVRYTVLERTLIDGLQNPELTGGIGNVLRAWVIARDRIDLDVLVSQTERFGIAVLRQRVGYILDQLDLGHPNLDVWQRAAKRGGSSRLVGSLPFAPVFDERWSLSLNAPVDALTDGAP